MQAEDKIAQYNAGRKKEDATRFCHAPFNNLFFGNRGYVMACCFNKLHVLGMYPQSSIKELWNGAKAQQLREAINKSDLSLGCQGCAALYENQNFGALPARVYDNHSHGNRYPKRMEFELDNTCNLECVMCSGEFSSSIRERRERLPAIPSPYGKAFIEELEEYIPYLETAQFLGGEPFLIPMYFEIWEKMISLNPNIKISTQTNGTILNAKVKGLLEKLNVSISISIDSLNKDVYPTIRINGNLDRVLDNIEYFSNYVKQKNTGFSFSFCPMQQNWKEIPDMVAFANKHQAIVFFNTVSHPANCSLMSLSSYELYAIVDYLKQFDFPESTSSEKINKGRYKDMINEVTSLAQNAEKQSTTPCGPLPTYEQYLQQLADHVMAQPNLDDAAKQHIAEKLKQKIGFIIAKAETEGLRPQAEIGVVTQSHALTYQALTEMEDMERVYILFKERVLKLV